MLFLLSLANITLCVRHRMIYLSSLCLKYVASELRGKSYCQTGWMNENSNYSYVTFKLSNKCKNLCVRQSLSQWKRFWNKSSCKCDFRSIEHEKVAFCIRNSVKGHLPLFVSSIHKLFLNVIKIERKSFRHLERWKERYIRHKDLSCQHPSTE